MLSDGGCWTRPHCGQVTELVIGPS
jgi:hypothetical protein